MHSRMERAATPLEAGIAGRQILDLLGPVVLAFAAQQETPRADAKRRAEIIGGRQAQEAAERTEALIRQRREQRGSTHSN